MVQRLGTAFGRLDKDRQILFGLLGLIGLQLGRRRRSTQGFDATARQSKRGQKENDLAPESA